MLQVAEMMRKENDTELKLEKKMNEAKMRRCSVAVDTVSLDTTKPRLVSIDTTNIRTGGVRLSDVCTCGAAGGYRGGIGPGLGWVGGLERGRVARTCTARPESLAVHLVCPRSGASA